jgi:hypothetical protein
MFIALLAIVLVLSAIVCFAVTLVFRKQVDRILQRLVGEDIYTAWSKYLLFAVYVVGISGGVRVWELDRYITPAKDQQIIELTSDRWFLEIFRTVIGTLQSVAWVLLLFFLVALIALMLVKGREMKRQNRMEESPETRSG